jgi:hypothetical protein
MTKQGSAGKGTKRGAATLPSQSILSGPDLRVDANVKWARTPVLEGSTQEKPSSEICRSGCRKALNDPAGAGVPDRAGSGKSSLSNWGLSKADALAPEINVIRLARRHTREYFLFVKSIADRFLSARQKCRAFFLVRWMERTV